MKQLYRIRNKIENSKLYSGFLATFIGSGASKIILVLATFLCANLLGKEEFGELSFIRNTLNMILCICALNFTTLSTKFTTEAKTSKDSFQRLFLLFLFSVSVCVAIGIFLIATPSNLLLKLLSTEVIVKFFKIAAVLLPLFILQPLIEGVLRGMKEFKLIGILQTISSILYLIAVYAGIKLCGITGALYGVILYYLLYSVATICILLRRYSLKRHIPLLNGFWKQKSALYIMILPIFLMSFIDAPVMWFAQVILSKAGSMEAIGSMTAMMQIRNLAILIPGYFTNTYLAFAGDLNAQQKHGDYYKQYAKIEKLYFVIGLSLFFCFSILAKPILLLYGSDFISDWPVMVISNIGIPITMFIGLYRIDLIIKDHQQYLLYISMAWNAVWLITLYLMIELGVSPLYSFFWSQNIGAIVFVASLYYIYKKDKIKLTRDYEKD
ncbi:MAG: oligosaccharide flippase family protein [Fibrobacter sp.]|nr:oligosaccharide flippase family protein [Fibrobacter sp.]